MDLRALPNIFDNLAKAQLAEQESVIDTKL
jgi:hypothetical protein